MPTSDLTFNAVDDLVGAHVQGKLAKPSQARFSPSRIGPLIELSGHDSNGRVGPLLSSPWLDRGTQIDLRDALAGDTNLWFDGPKLRGFMRGTFSPLEDAHEVERTGFLVAARVAAGKAGFSAPVAQSLTAAIREMENNIHEHSELPETGIMAFQTTGDSFEFVIADCGVGVLATLREAPEYHQLSDHGRALHTALQPGTSRYGKDAHRGMGFRDLFLGLASLNADLRFRSGDHALTISGPHPELKVARLAQKPFYQGFLASVRCELPRAPHTLH